MTEIKGIKEQPWVLKTPSGTAEYTMYKDETHTPPILVCTVGKTAVGVIYSPVKDEMFTAIRGQGARLNKKPIALSEVGRLEEAIVNIGEFGRHGNEVNREQIKELTIVADHARRIRITGTSCTDLAWVACGRADAFIMHGGNPWDVKAGRVILEESGGKISSHKYDSGNILTIYTNKLLHQELLNVLGVDREPANDEFQKQI